MIACGAGLVDLDLPDALANFDGLDIPFLAAPTPEGIAEQIAEALHNEPLRQRRVAAGIEYGNSMIDESEMAELFWDYVTNKRDDVSRTSKVLEREAV
jgi:arginyl-tRNA synthetase